jgi:hypothetical protein
MEIECLNNVESINTKPSFFRIKSMEDRMVIEIRNDDIL